MNANVTTQIFAQAGLPWHETEFRFHPVRKFRFDYAWVEQKVALEVDGGIFTGGRHTRPLGFLRDQEKKNLAACLGWRILYCQPSELHTRKTIDMLKQVLISC